MIREERGEGRWAWREEGGEEGGEGVEKGLIRPGQIRLGKARQDKARHDKARHGKARTGNATATSQRAPPLLPCPQVPRPPPSGNMNLRDGWMAQGCDVEVLLWRNGCQGILQGHAGTA